MSLTRTLGALSVALTLVSIPACENWNRDHDHDGNGTMHRDTRYRTDDTGVRTDTRYRTDDPRYRTNDTTGVRTDGNPNRPTGPVDSGIGGTGTSPGGATGGGTPQPSGTSGGTGSTQTPR
jgi:hypothetical protein